MKSLIANLARIGIYPTDDDNTILRKQFVVYQGSAMGLGGLLWGTLLLAFNFPIPSIIPYGYTLITIINFFFFDKYKNFAVARNVQTIISLCLPFFLQWSLGGFVVSGGVMIWAVLALVSSVTYQNRQSSIFLFLGFTFLTLISLSLDTYFKANFNMGVNEYVSLVFLVVNILCVSIFVFLLMVYFSQMNFSNMEKIKQSYAKLINSEKLAVLGQISAGVAHEINTPLGAIKSSAEESAMGFEDCIPKLPYILSLLSDEEKKYFIDFVSKVRPQQEFLSTREEREKKKLLRSNLEELGVVNARFISDRLVQVGIYQLLPEIKKLSRHEKFEELMTVAYNLLNQQKNNRTIQLAVDKASRIILALKHYLHKTNSNEPEPVDIVQNIETVLTIYQNRLKQGIQVVKNFQDVPEVMALPDELNQVWTNLIVNAIQAMDHKGTLTIEVETKGSYVVVSIKDSGKGIPKNIQKKIFDPFFTTKSSGEGSGLGLDIIKRILTHNAGEISFESEENVGTTFFVKLPIKQK